MVRKKAGVTEGWQEFAIELGHQIRRLRVAKELSQEALAFRAGLTRFTVQRYEAGEGQTGSPANPSLRTVVALSQVLDVPVEELLPANRPDVTIR
ncbi:helix-turn-helix transcriptional regulator [Microbacterium sp. NPDC059771]|uniref:helix-turn-helix transcriptional regulator n=1 Tax=Microbacterium sp. NPDC059771 TaxID=3346941 RepID=UPI00364CF34D